MTPDYALQWLQIVATGLLRAPAELRDPDDLVHLLDLMLVPSLLDVSHLGPEPDRVRAPARRGFRRLGLQLRRAEFGLHAREQRPASAGTFIIEKSPTAIR